MDEYTELDSAYVGHTVQVVLLRPAPVEVDGEEYYIVITVNRPLRAYLVREDQIERNMRIEQEIDPDQVIEAYDWNDEILWLFPTLEDVRERALLSFYRAGAVKRDDVHNVFIRRKMLNQALPSMDIILENLEDSE